MELCYVEDTLGGFFCLEKNITKQAIGSYAIYCKGTLEEVETYLGYKIPKETLKQIYK